MSERTIPVTIKVKAPTSISDEAIIERFDEEVGNFDLDVEDDDGKVSVVEIMGVDGR